MSGLYFRIMVLQLFSNTAHPIIFTTMTITEQSFLWVMPTYILFITIFLMKKIEGGYRNNPLLTLET